MLPSLTDADKEALRQDVLKAKRFGEFWDERAQRLMHEYGGQWVLFVGTSVVAHDPDPEKLDEAIAKLGPDRAEMIVQYVPRPTERFAL